MVADPLTSTRSGAGPTDAALVIAARAGETWAQEALFRRYARMAFGLSHRILAGREEADDVVQDAFVYALNSLHSLTNPQAFAAWLGSIVTRTAGKRLRRHRLLVRLGIRHPEPFDASRLVSKSASPEVAAELRAVYTMLDTLPVSERVALVLRRVEGMELTEIAGAMGLSLATVKRRLAAAERRVQARKGE